MEQTLKTMCEKDGKRTLAIYITLDKEQIETMQPIRLEIDFRNENNQVSKTFDIVKGFRSYAERYVKKDRRMVTACVVKFEAFCHLFDKDVTCITQTDCREFCDFLYDNLHGNTPGNYFKKFRQYLDTLVYKGVFATNPCNHIPIHYSDYRTKEILSEEDIVCMMRESSKRDDVCRAFLFSCFTGLRWCDIKALKWENIDIDKCTMTIEQQKVAGHSKKSRLSTYLNTSAMKLIDRCKHGREDGLVFKLPTYNIMYKALQYTANETGIKKHLSFHCARHTFISRLVEKGVDIKTVADLAGHSTTRHTERYMHTFDTHLKECLKRIDI